jgi:signal transduction histidine kinase
MLWGIIAGATPPSIMCVILPRFGYYYLNWLGPATEIIWIPIIAYSIIRYRQMDVRAVITEVLAIGMAVIFFINIFIETSFGLWSRVATFVTFFVMAYFLVRATLKEAKQREELDDLNSSLSQKVAEQTKEVREAYEIEKKARRDLEKLNDSKNQFIMITQHHLRTPVTTIDWELESMLAGAYGSIMPELKTAIIDTQTAAKRLTHIIDDFLNIAALKAGGSILNLSRHSLKPAIIDILGELKLDIARMRIAVTYPQDETDWPELSIDHDKMREILLIIMENAVKYNRDSGFINISTRAYDDRFEISIENSGIGITFEETEKIGSALFYRGQSARSINPTGMGIGLSVAKAIIRAHHGIFSIKSNGAGKGTVVTVTLPLEQEFGE